MCSLYAILLSYVFPNSINMETVIFHLHVDGCNLTKPRLLRLKCTYDACGVVVISRRRSQNLDDVVVDMSYVSYSSAFTSRDRRRSTFALIGRSQFS